MGPPPLNLQGAVSIAQIKNGLLYPPPLSAFFPNIGHHIGTVVGETGSVVELELRSPLKLYDMLVGCAAKLVAAVLKSLPPISIMGESGI
jgi:hypothetical protein